MFKTTLVALLLVEIISANMFSHMKLQSSGTQVCPDPIYRTDDSFNSLISKVNEANYVEDKLAALKTEVPKDNRVFSSKQILSIFDQVTFSSAKTEALQILNPYIQQLSGDDIVKILKNLVYSSKKLEVLGVIADTLVDKSDSVISNIVENGFDFANDKAEAKSILVNAKTRNCLYGTISEKVAIFIVDVSGSMGTTFSAPDGKKYTRLEYVKAQLSSTISEQLKDYQKFNVIAFDDRVRQWSSDCLSATADNIKLALTWIKSLQPGGSTGISYAIQAAYNTKEDLEAIFFLSDGDPNSGITDPSQMKVMLTNANNDKVKKGLHSVRVNVVSFFLGGTESDSTKTRARQYMTAMADATKGTFRDLNEKSSKLKDL